MHDAFLNKTQDKLIPKPITYLFRTAGKTMSFLYTGLTLLSIWGGGLGQTCLYGTAFGGLCECWRGYKGSDCSVFDATLLPSGDSVAGMNLAGVNYYSQEWVFVDVMKSGMWWVTQREGDGRWNTQEHHLVTWRSDGFPASLPAGMKLATLMNRDGQHTAAGRYVVLYEGDGYLNFKFAATVVSRSPGRIELDVTPSSGGILMEITRTTAGDPLHNIRVILPGFEDRYQNFPFHPMFLESLRRYKVLRFMDWGATNNHPENITWADRRQTTYYSQGGGPERRGVAYEYMILLANMLGASPWICVPHGAPDDYVRNLATLLRDTVRLDLKIYVEWSNEVWNGIFSQNRYAASEGQRLGFATRPWEAAWKYTAYRSVQIFDIFKQVFGPSQRGRLDFVLATQKANPYVSRQIWSFQNAYRSADSGAITGYFCGHLGSRNMEDFALSATIDQLWDNCTASFDSQADLLRRQADTAQEFNLKLITYEAGQHIVQARAISGGGAGANITAKFIAMNRSPRIGEVQDQWLALYKRTVMDHPVNRVPPHIHWLHFSSVSRYTRYGSWGVFEYTGQAYSEANKYNSLQRFIRSWGQAAPDRTCSFVTVSSASFGCFQRQFEQAPACFRSTDSGQTWQMLPSISVEQGSVLVLDGVHKESSLVFVRNVNTLSQDQHLTLSNGATSWTSVKGEDYHSQLASGNVQRAFAPGDNRGLDTQAVNCT